MAHTNAQDASYDTALCNHRHVGALSRCTHCRNILAEYCAWRQVNPFLLG